jgi:competence protein ComEC
MPAVLATLLAMPFGLEAWPLTAMGFGIDGMTWVARRVASLPGAVTLVPAIPGAAFALMIGGGLWLCLWGESWRLAGLLPIAVGIAIAPWRAAPDVLIGGGGALVAVRGDDGHLAAIGSGRASFELARWLEHDADPRRPGDVKLGRSIVCDSIGCRALVRGNEVAIARHPAALRDDCDRATVIVWAGRGEASCVIGQRARLVTSGDVGRDGAHVVYFQRDETGGAAAAADGRGDRRRPSAGATDREPHRAMTIETVAGWRGNRPWARTREPVRPGKGT